MNETKSVESKPTQPVCARCGSRLGSADNAEAFCVTCLLHAALGDEDVDHTARPYRFDQYELVTDDNGSPVELGRGAMGVTYKAFDTNLRCEVALKVIHPRYLADESSRARFLSEARAAAQLRHRNIASVFHLGTERGEYFYTMELVEGETIENRVRRKGPIDCPTALDVTLQITRALIAAGDRKFVHRDVKPSNIMLCTEADDAIVAKLIDFGLVRGITEKFAPATASAVRELAGRTNLLDAGSNEFARGPVRTGFIGTPHYASPEQFAGERTDARSDIYSLGVTLWFMLTGRLPFDGTRDEIHQKQLSKALPLDQLKGTPRPVVDLIKRMLDADPARRLQSPAALKEQLNNCIATIDAAKQKQRRRFVYGTLTAAVILAGSLAAFYILQRKPVPGPASEIVPERSIAVLSFTNLIPESDSAYVVDGIRTQIAARLAKITNLKVVSGSSTQRYETSPQNPAKVATELGVADLLEGNVRKLGEKFQIAVRLIDGKTGADLWTQSYERTFPEITQVEGEVVRHAAGALGFSLTESEKQAINKAATSNPRAYEAYLKGRYVWLQRNLDSYRQAREYFEQAIALDPNYAQAYAGLADAYQFLGAFILPDRKENYDKAKRAYKHALELDPTLAEAHASAGLVAMNYDSDWPLAEEELRRAIALNPNEPIFYDWYGEYLMAVGKVNESIDNIERARELDPFSIIINSDVGKLLCLARLYDQAETQLKETLRMDPAFMQAHIWLGIVYLMKHRFDEAIAEFNREIDGGQGLKAYAYGMAGRKTEARQMLEATKNLTARRGDMDRFWLACAYTGVGDKEHAIASLEQDCENHGTVAVSLRSNPLFDPLRSEPRFVDLMRRVHLTPGGSPTSEIVPEKSIAVLPFENLSDDKEQEVFADGVQDDVLTKLAKIADLKVISRASVMQYRGKQDSRQIGRELGVSHALEGTARRSGGKVHVNAQLVDTRTGMDVWAEEYDRDLNEVFAIEAELAQSVANQLRASVSSSETWAIQERPTQDLAAYDLYIRAKNLVVRTGTESSKAILLSAIDLLNQAVARDPKFLEAHCLLAWAHDQIYFLGLDHTQGRLALAESAIEKASRLRPEAGETHLARAWDLYVGHLDYNAALDELGVAHQTLPNNAQIPRLAGLIHRRQGHWQESMQNLQRAVDLDPLDAFTLIQIAYSYGCLRRYAEKERALDRARAIQPNDVGTKMARAIVDLDWKGDTRPLHAAIDEIRTKNPNDARSVADDWLYCALAERDVDALREAVVTAGENLFNLGDAVVLNRPFVEGIIARMMKDEEKARSAFTAARVEQEKTIQAQPNYGPAFCALGLIDAALGRKEEALREGRRAVALLPVEKDAVNGPLMIEYLAMIAAWVGDKDLACEQLATVVHRPSNVGYGELKLMPYWDPLRGDPRFEKIVASLAPEPSGTSENVPEKSIAVLPFENLSDDKEHAFFADGVQDEILTRLSKIADLKVISRTSTQRYKSAPENLPEIGRQLGVANILEGQVQKNGDTVRVNVQLIKAANDSHVWADTFDRKLTDVLALESEVAEAIADQLQAKLTGQEQQLIAVKPTDNPQAYDAYLRGLAYVQRTSATQANCLSAQKYLREAVHLDPHFALAWALLSYVDADGYITTMLQPTVALREEARQAADTALTLQPHLGEALLAKGQYHYACLKDYDTAMRYFEEARPFLPNNSQVPQLLAYVTRRRGQWDQSETYFNEAERLDPRNVSILAQHALSYIHLRRFPEALRKLDQVLDIIPDDVDTLVSEASVAQAEGDLSRAAALLTPLHTGTDNTDALETQVYEAILERHPEAVIPHLNDILTKPDPALGYFNGELRFWLGWAQKVAGNHAAAQKSWSQARSELEPFLKEQQENHLLLGYLALTNMSLGDKKTSFALAERAMALVPIEKDASSGPAQIEVLARVAAQMGEPDRAISALQKLLSMPYEAPLASNPPLTPALLRLDPMFDPLRNDPRFQKLVASQAPN